jgi:hypothetical protein
LTLTVLSPLLLLAGIAGLALGLYLLQRLRVRHRELEVVTTLFWREAVEERRVWVFMRRFRHLAAYLLLLAIASILWLLVSGPTAESADGRRHVVLLDGAAAMSRDGRFEQAVTAAVDLAGRLPAARREVRLIAGDAETVLASGEPMPLLAERLAGREPVAAPGGLEAAVLEAAAAATDDSPVSVYLVGDAAVRMSVLDRLPDTVSVDRVPLDGTVSANRGIVTLGVSEAASGAWETVDVIIEVAPAPEEVPAEALSVTIDGNAMGRPLERVDPGRFLVRDVPAQGEVLSVHFVQAAFGGAIAHDDTASVTLPRRPRIATYLEAGVPESLRSVLALDPAVRLVGSGDAAEVVIGTSADASLQLVDDAATATFTIVVDDAEVDPVRLAETLVDDLAIRQIDAVALAEQAGREIRLDLEAGDARRIAVWQTLVEEQYDFRDTRAFPVFVARAVRWLAARPALVPWARAGEPLPMDGPIVERPARDGDRTLADGRVLRVSLLEREPGAGALTSGDEVEPAEGRGLDLFGLIGLLLAALLALEWVLYQRGRIP